MSIDGVTLTNGTENDTAAEYGRRCEKIGEERRNLDDVQAAMSHPSFKPEHHALIDRLAREYRASLPLLQRPPRFSATLGTFGSKEAMIKTVEAGGHKFSDYARQIIANPEFTLLADPAEYDFWETTIKELTGKDQVPTTELYVTLIRLGFCEAPDESACAVRVAYTDQPMDEWRSVLSKPRAVAGGHLEVLYLVRDSDGSFVDSFSAYPGYLWDGVYRLLVCRKRPLAA